MPVAAERPASLVFLSHSEAAVRPSVLTMFPSLSSYAHGRYALTGRFPYRAYLVDLASRNLGLTRTTCHRSAYLYVPRLSLLSLHETFTIYARVMVTRLDSPLRHGDVVMTSTSYVCPRLCLSSLSSCRFSLRPVLYPVRFLPVTYPTGRYFYLLPLRPLRLLVLVFPVLVYILGWRWDDPHLQSTLQPP